jgi:hypothetical protein
MGPTTYRYSRRHFLALSGGAIITGFAAAQGASLAVADDVPATADIYDVTDFGATGDGITDDMAAIQAAAAAIPATGGTLSFPPGTYIVSPTREAGIAVKSNMRIAGSGGDSILKIHDHNGDWGALFVQPDGRVAVQNVTVESLSFDANILNNPESKVVNGDAETYQTFIYITNGQDLRVRGCAFDPYAGVWAIAFNGKTIDNCAVTDCSFRFVMREDNPDFDNSGIYIDGTNYAVSGNTFTTIPQPYHEGRGAIEAHGGPAQVFGNTATGYQTLVNISGSAFPGGNSSNIVCRDNTAQDALIAIMLWPSAANTLSNITVENNTLQMSQLKHGTADIGGVSVVFSYEATGKAANITIKNNHITFQDEGAGRPGNFYYDSGGILLHNLGGTNGAVIEGNTIERALTGGIVIGLPEMGNHPFQNIRVANNTIINPGQNVAFPEAYRGGILVNSSAANVEIVGNTITDTYPAPRCPAAIAFDLGDGFTYTGIRVKENKVKAGKGTLAMVLPDGAVQ